MARSGVTEAQVFAIVDGIVSAGERPTIERIRALLGTGSPNTVMRHLESWWRALGARLEQQAAKLALPEAPTEVVVAASAMWDAALQQARNVAATNLAQLQRALAEDRERLEAQCAAADTPFRANRNARQKLDLRKHLWRLV